MSECNKSGKSCPIHGYTVESLRVKAGFHFKQLLMCLCGGLETKDGTLFDESDAQEVLDRTLENLDPRR